MRWFIKETYKLYLKDELGVSLSSAYFYKELCDLFGSAVWLNDLLNVKTTEEQKEFFIKAFKIYNKGFKNI